MSEQQTETPISDATPHNIADLAMLCRKLERELDAANARIYLLEAALLPFAQIGDIENDHDSTLWKRAVSAGSVRFARSLFESKQHKP